MKKLLSIFLVLCLSLSILSGCGDKDSSDGDKKPPLVTSAEDDAIGVGACEYIKTRDDGTHDFRYVKMTVKGHGTMIIALDATTAPVTVENFMTLVNKGFYNGLTFHRILDGFMIQGGDPKADGTGGNTDKNGNEINIKGEFANNGHPNDISHIKGVISMARSGNQYNPSAAYNTASSQFFICNADATSLDGDYASFGYVIAGLSVVDSITAEGMLYTNSYYNGMIYQKEYQPVIASASEISKEDALKNASVPESEIDFSAYYKTRDIKGHNVKYVKMTVKDHGDIVLLLDATTAPVTVENFLMLVNKGFYNGLTFHRIMEGFMIQGGDPDADGTGGNRDENGNKIEIKGEFANNNHPNDISHKRGVISMARSGNQYNPSSAYNTASSQFFICNTDYPYLDGDYASFGYVISGLSVVDSITEEGVKYASNGVISDKSKQPVITSVTEITEAKALSYVNGNHDDAFEGPLVDVEIG